MSYLGTNCRVIKPTISNKLDEGWIGVDEEGNYHFKPTRGSGGFALYGTEKICLSNTGCPKAVKVALTWIPFITV